MIEKDFIDSQNARIKLRLSFVHIKKEVISYNTHNDKSTTFTIINL